MSVDDAPPAPPLAAPALAADAADPYELPDRQIAFGPWTISELWPDGVFSGYGANCNRHFGIEESELPMLVQLLSADCSLHLLSPNHIRKHMHTRYASALAFANKYVSICM